MTRRYATLDTLMSGQGGVHDCEANVRHVSVSGMRGVVHPCTAAPPEDPAASDQVFATHTAYPLPSVGKPGPRHAVHSAHGPRREGPAAARYLHVLRLHPRLAKQLQADLLPRARSNARSPRGSCTADVTVGGGVRLE